MPESHFPKIPKILYLTIDDVRTVGLTDEDFINCVSEVFIQHGYGRVNVHPGIEFCPQPGTSFQAAAGWVEKSGTAGIKWVSACRDPLKPEITRNCGVIVLNDQKSGLPYALLDSFYITVKSTAAITAVSARLLARGDSTTVAILGAGAQGRESLKMLQFVLPRLNKAKIFDIRPDVINSYIRAMAEEFRGEIVSCSTIKEAVQDADVLLVTATCFDSIEHQIKDVWLPREGMFISPIAMVKLFERDTIARMDKVTTDDQQAKYFAVNGNIPGGLPEFYGEISEIMLGRKVGRENECENILALDYGLPLHDIHIGHKIYEVARENGIGIWLDPLTW